MSLEFREPSDGFSKVPILPVLDTREYIEKKLEERWQAPENAQDRELFEKWVKFCNLAQEGQRITQRTAEEDIMTYDLGAIESFILATNLYSREENTMDKIDSAKRAFLVLTGELKESDIQENEIKEAKKLVELFSHEVLSSKF